MKTFHLTKPAMNRRHFLRASGVSVVLPFLEAMIPSFARASSSTAPKRMVFINRALGLNADQFFPLQTGKDYVASPYLRELEPLRSHFTVCSGLAHPDQTAGHASEASFLTSAPLPGRPGFQNSVSVDQLAAEHIEGQTRHPFLAFCSHEGTLSWTRNGVPVPSEKDPAAVFRRLFLTGTPEEVARQEQAMADGHSILDLVGEEISELQRQLGPGDRERLDQYFTAVRTTERRLLTADAWLKRPKPKVPVEKLGPFPDPSDIVGRSKMIYDLMHLALQTDSTRLITFIIDANGGGAPPIAGVSDSRHNLSHHGLDPEKLRQLRAVEQEEMRCLAAFLTSLHGTTEGGGTLLDETMVLYGSNLGNASSHDPRDLPILLAGGGFQHAGHLAFERDQAPPLSNLFVSMLQRFGMPVDRFGSSTGSLNGLSMA